MAKRVRRHGRVRSSLRDSRGKHDASARGAGNVLPRSLYAATSRFRIASVGPARHQEAVGTLLGTDDRDRGDCFGGKRIRSCHHDSQICKRGHLGRYEFRGRGTLVAMGDRTSSRLDRRSHVHDCWYLRPDDVSRASVKSRDRHLGRVEWINREYEEGSQ